MLAVPAANALLQAALGRPPLDAALFPFGVDVSLPEELLPRVVRAARDALERAGSQRIFAVRALGHTRLVDAVQDLGDILASEDATPAERIAAAGGLARIRARRA